MNEIDVGDPAASSLSSCLCAFPGGFSLLTEKGLLRPFLVSKVPQEGSAAEATVVAVAATPVCLSTPSPEGSFPAGEDVPVDHAWSQDGQVLVVLRRSGYRAYRRAARELDNSPLSQRRRPSADERAEDSGSRAEDSSRTRPGSAAASLGLAEAYVGSNGFHGKVVACCLLGAPSAAAAPRSSVCSEGSMCGSGSGQTYLIAVGGTHGIECHELELRQREESSSEVGKRAGNATQDEGNPISAPPPATCRPLRNVFQGYLVVALAFSPDSGLMAAAAMTGHVKVWDVAALVVPASPPQQPSRQPNGRSIPARKEPREAARGGRGGGKKKGGFDEAFRAIRLRPGRAESSELPALWGLALPMARATSLSFSPEDDATFALACWDGKVALFLPLPTVAVEAAASPPGPRLSETRQDNIAESGRGRGRGSGGSKGVDGRRSWKHLWREAAAAASPSKKPGGKGGGKGGGNLEDQDGAFLCWCKGPAGSEAPAVGLAVTAYSVKTGECPGQRCEEEYRSSDSSAPSKDGAMPTPITGEQSSHAPFPPAVATGPGFELFEGGGLGERVGGAVSGSRPPGLTPEPTAERYLIHGLAAGPSFVALYDSDLCLHVISLAAILDAGRVLPPPLPPPPRPTAIAEALPAVEEAGTSASAGAVDEEASASLLVDRVTLASNDHGLVAACLRRHRGPDGVGSVAQPEDGLELFLTWRNAISGSETPDNGECVGKGSGGDGRRLPFLPGELAEDDRGVGGGNGGVFDADIRWGRVALFTRYSVLVYTRPGRGNAAGNIQGAKGTNDFAASPAGGWSAYAEAPAVHGLLLGGASTASPLSQRLPEPPADLTNIYLLTVLGNGGGAGARGPLLSLRSLSDRSVSCRCPLTCADGDDNKEAGRAASKRGLKVYAAPGYGGGVFAVAAEGGQGECAEVWRGTFDEGNSRLEVGPSRVVTSYPWPEPETLRLQGVAGPNCELFLFKEEIGSKSDRGAKADSKGNVRWWMTWPEAEIWRFVDAPALLGDEDLGVAEFVKIFQLEIEEMLSPYPRPGADDRTPPAP